MVIDSCYSRWNNISSFIVLIVCLFQAMTTYVYTYTLPPVHWNRTNPIFKASSNAHVIEAQLHDDIDFICPSYDITTESSTSTNNQAENDGESNNEYYLVYLVSRREYEDCNAYHDYPPPPPVLNCSRPQNSRMRFTILFEPIQSIPNSPDFQPGGTYYFITTSTGQKDGLKNLYKGACADRNMKLIIKVCCSAEQNNAVEYPFGPTFNDQPGWTIPTDKNLRQETHVSRTSSLSSRRDNHGVTGSQAVFRFYDTGHETITIRHGRENDNNKYNNHDDNSNHSVRRSSFSSSQPGRPVAQRYSSDDQRLRDLDIRDDLVSSDLASRVTTRSPSPRKLSTLNKKNNNKDTGDSIVVRDIFMSDSEYKSNIRTFLIDNEVKNAGSRLTAFSSLLSANFRIFAILFCQKLIDIIILHVCAMIV